MRTRLKPIEHRTPVAPVRPPKSMAWAGCWLGVIACALGVSPIPNVSAQVVNTLGGAFAGFADGDTLQVSQFHTPLGLALDASGRLLVADRDNGMIRELDLDANRTRTVVSGLNQPVDVATDSGNTLYVLSRGAQALSIYDRFGNLQAGAGFSPLTNPVALAVDAQTNVFVAEASGIIRQFNSSGAAVKTFTVPAAGVRLSGIAIYDEERVAVSDEGTHAVWMAHLTTGAVTLWAGGNGAGSLNGAKADAQLNLPQRLAAGLNGALVVADSGNHRVRLISCEGAITTLYGIAEEQWETFPDPSIFPGWADGPAEFAEARNPVGVAVSPDGTVYVTETYYHIIREITGATFPAGNCSGTTVSGPVGLPVLNPASGYFPMGALISVTSSNTVSFAAGTLLFYTTDGSEPTTNSIPLPLNASNIGVLDWNENQRDLTSLRVRAFRGTNSSPSIAGTAVDSSGAFKGEVGIPRSRDGQPFSGGTGATIALPVVANLGLGQTLRSLQFVVEVAPIATNQLASPPPLRGTTAPRVVPMSPNDFIPIVAATTDLPTTFPNPVGTDFQLGVAYVGTNEVFAIQNFGVVAMLAVPIPAGAIPGQQYRVSIRNISATSDGAQATVPLKAMPDSFIEIANRWYRAGDSSPARWYNAGEFGNPIPIPPLTAPLGSGDVNNVFYASLGFRVPYQFSDAFDAMDVFPIDSQGLAGGDGQIRFLDWQILLRRSFGFDPNQWLRRWSTGGIRIAEIEGGSFLRQALVPAESFSSETSGSSWSPSARLRAESVSFAAPGSTVSVPVYLDVRAGESVSGMQFVATVRGSGGDAVTGPVRFSGAQRQPDIQGNTVPGIGSVAGAVYCAWHMGSLAAEAPNFRIGAVEFDLPLNAQMGGQYEVAITAADGGSGAAADAFKQHDFETLRAVVAVGTAAPPSHRRVSDEWKARFLTGAPSGNDDDPDGDGLANWMEYAAGTDPISSDWKCRLEENGIALRWFGESSRQYIIEESADLSGWKQVEILDGANRLATFRRSVLSNTTAFYRIRLAP